MEMGDFDSHELDRQWAAKHAWEMRVPEVPLARLEDWDEWREPVEPLVSAAVADYLEEWFRL